MKEETTWSPLEREETPSPTSMTSPAASWPRMSGSGIASVPLVADRSEWHTPEAASFKVTSFPLGGSTVISSTTTGRLSSRQIAARAWRAISLPRLILVSCRMPAQYIQNSHSPEEIGMLFRDKFYIGGRW